VLDVMNGVRACAREPRARAVSTTSHGPCRTLVLQVRVRAHTRVLSTIEYTIEKRVTLERNNEWNVQRCVEHDRHACARCRDA
jgi:hypothetical protein